MAIQNRPNLIRLTHQWGSTTMPLVDPNTGVVTTVLAESDGEKRNAYVTELVPERDTIFLEGEGVTRERVGSAYILSLLKDENPGYQQHRSAFFIEQGFLDDRMTYETTRLHADIYTAVAAQRPDLFEPEELTNLPGYIFKKHMTNRPADITPEEANKWKLDFSQTTARNVAAYIRDKSMAASVWRYSGLGPIYNWLNGETIHPTHNSRRSEQIKTVPTADLAEDFVTTARALGAEDLAVRASEIADTERRAMGDDYAKRGSPYFEIVDAHRSAVRDMRGIMRDVKDGKHSNGQKKHAKGRVHEEMPNWKVRVLERLEPLLEHSVVGSRFYGADIVELPEHREETRARGRGLPIRVLTTTDDEHAKKAYASTGIIKTPARRSANLRTSLLKSYELLGGIYRAAVPFYIRDIQQDTSGNIHLIPRRANVNFSHVKPDGRSMICIPVDDIRYLSPQFGYSHERLVDSWAQWAKLLSRAKQDRNFRRDFLRLINSNLPDEHPAADMMKKAYSDSALLKKLFFNQRQFGREITTGMRSVDYNEMDSITHIPDAEFRKGNLSMRERYDELSAIFSGIGRACADPIEELKHVDAHIPDDVTLFRLFPRAMSASMDTLKTHSGERALFRQVVSMYGIDAAEAAAAYEDTILQAAQATHDRVNELMSENGIKGRIAFAMLNIHGRPPEIVNV